LQAELEFLFPDVLIFDFGHGGGCFGRYV